MIKSSVYEEISIPLGSLNTPYIVAAATMTYNIYILAMFSVSLKVSEIQYENHDIQPRPDDMPIVVIEQQRIQLPCQIQTARYVRHHGFVFFRVLNTADNNGDVGERPKYDLQGIED